MRGLGERLAGLLRPGDLVVLTGPLGAGKTTLVQGIGQGLGVRGPVTSPTFVIARVHPSQHGGPALVHADAYRLGSRAEVDDLDLDADLDRSVTVVEWGEGLVEELAQSYLEIEIALAPPGGAAGPARPGGAAEPGPPGGTAGPALPGGAAGPAPPGGAAGPAPPGGAAEPAPTGGAAEPPWAAPDAGRDEPADEPRVVRLTGTGSRWAGVGGALAGGAGPPGH